MTTMTRETAIRGVQRAMACSDPEYVDAIITALAAPPPVDVRKVMHSAPEWVRTGGKARLRRDLTDMLKRAGYEVIDE